MAMVPGGNACSDPTAGSQTLTRCEISVLRLLRGTLSLREIGQQLFVSVNTVKTHKTNIYRKLGVSTRCEAVIRASRLGLLDTPDGPPDSPLGE
jgi:DNA-binding NarL/FixJ family response regulator